MYFEKRHRLEVKRDAVVLGFLMRRLRHSSHRKEFYAPPLQPAFQHIEIVVVVVVLNDYSREFRYLVVGEISQ